MNCRICDGGSLTRLRIDSFLFPAVSYDPDFHEYENFICSGCGVVSGQPEPNEDHLIAHYNSVYRRSHSACEIDGELIDTPVDLAVSERSLKRVRNFHTAMTRNVQDYPDLKLGPEDTVVDFGAYQGMFLFGIFQLWACRCIASDYNRKGISFARSNFGFDGSRVTEDIYSDTFDEPVSIATMVHSLEHLREPVRFLKHLRKNILSPDGFIYIEVPNLYGIALCEPTHFFTYSNESLTFLLERSGFQVLDIFTSGYPETLEFTGHNDIQNLICLARPNQQLETPSVFDVDVEKIRRHLQQSYARHSAASVNRQLKTAFREIAKFFYYFGFSVVLERLSPAIMMRLALRLGIRKKSGFGTTRQK
jgi:hypothetical protein